MWMSLFSRKSCGDAEALGVRADVAQRGLRALLHDVAELPGELSLPVPCIRVASMKRISPPTGVQARPVATPGSSVRSATSLVNGAGPRNARTSLLASHDDRRRRRPFGDLHGDAADDRGDLPLERADAGLARVAVDDELERLVGDLELLGA